MLSHGETCGKIELRVNPKGGAENGKTCMAYMIDSPTAWL